jgi:hypothetical protein
MIRRCLALLALPALAACASAQSAYPSLAIRPGERVTGTMTPAPAAPAPPPATPAATLDRLVELTGEASAAHRQFLDQVAGARGAVAAARGAEVGSDAWAAGQLALAGLDAARSKTMLALTDLDRLYVDAVTGDAAAQRIGAARGEVEQLVAAENVAVDELTRAGT